MSTPQLREEEGITFVLLDGLESELERLSEHSDGSSQGEFSFEEVARGLSSPASLDDNDFVRYDSLDKLPSSPGPQTPLTTITTAPQSSKQCNNNNNNNNNKPKRSSKGKKRTKKNNNEQHRGLTHGIKQQPTHHDPPPMPLKHHKTYTMEFSTEYDIVGSENGDSNIIYFALEDTGKLGGLCDVFNSYKFVRVVASFSRIYDGPLNGSIFTTLLHKDSKVPSTADIALMKADKTCMEVDMAAAPQFTRSLTPRSTHSNGSKSSKALNEWLPILNANNATWFGIKYITDPTPATSSIYLVSLKYTIAFRA